ncbi:5993_t:CDS:2, partial [Ambispora leptoticha]
VTSVYYQKLAVLLYQNDGLAKPDVDDPDQQQEASCYVITGGKNEVVPDSTERG